MATTESLTNTQAKDGVQTRIGADAGFYNGRNNVDSLVQQDSIDEDDFRDKDNALSAKILCRQGKTYSELLFRRTNVTGQVQSGTRPLENYFKGAQNHPFYRPDTGKGLKGKKRTGEGPEAVQFYMTHKRNKTWLEEENSKDLLQNYNDTKL